MNEQEIKQNIVHTLREFCPTLTAEMLKKQDDKSTDKYTTYTACVKEVIDHSTKLTAEFRVKAEYYHDSGKLDYEVEC